MCAWMKHVMLWHCVLYNLDGDTLNADKYADWIELNWNRNESNLIEAILNGRAANTNGAMKTIMAMMMLNSLDTHFYNIISMCVLLLLFFHNRITFVFVVVIFSIYRAIWSEYLQASFVQRFFLNTYLIFFLLVVSIVFSFRSIVSLAWRSKHWSLGSNYFSCMYSYRMFTHAIFFSSFFLIVICAQMRASIFTFGWTMIFRKTKR